MAGAARAHSCARVDDDGDARNDHRHAERGNRSHSRRSRRRGARLAPAASRRHHMIKQFIHRYIRNLERRYDYDATYMHELADISMSAFNRFTIMQMSGGQWGGGAPNDALFASGIAGALVEDCGPCVQIASDMAVGAGVSPETIRNLLSGTRSNSDAQLGFDYGLALLRG